MDNVLASPPFGSSSGSGDPRSASALSPCLRDRVGSAGWPRSVDHLVQRPASAPGPGRESPDRSISADRAIRPWGACSP